MIHREKDKYREKIYTERRGDTERVPWKVPWFVLACYLRHAKLLQVKILEIEGERERWRH